VDELDSKKAKNSSNLVESSAVQSFQFAIVQISTSVFLGIAFPLLAYSLIRHFYYGLDWIGIFSFKSADPPGQVQIVPEMQSFGLHYFGDYLLPHHWASLDNPWTSVEPNNYPPLAIIFFQILASFQYKTGLLLFEFMLFATTACVLWMSLRGRAKATKLNTILVFGLFSGPMIITMDRGNIVGFLALLTYVFAVFVIQKRWYLAALIAAIAVGIKLYPLVIFGIFVIYGKWKQLIIGIGSSLILVLGLFALYPGTFGKTLSGFWRGFSMFRNVDPNAVYCGNNSLTGGLLIFSEKFGDKSFSNLIAANALICGLGFSLLLFALMVKFRSQVWLVLVLSLSMLTATPAIVYGYSMVWVISALAIVFLASGGIEEFDESLVSPTDTNFDKMKLIKFTSIYLAILLVPYPIEWNHAYGIKCTTSIYPVIYFLSTLIWITYLISHKPYAPVKSLESFSINGS